MNEIISKTSSNNESNSQSLNYFSSNPTTAIASSTLNTLNQVKYSKLRDQQCETGILKQKIQDLTNDNRIYKAQIIRHERELKMFNQKKCSLPQIIENHESNTSLLKDQLRKTKLSYQQENKLRKEMELEIDKIKQKLIKNEEIISEEDLLKKYDFKKRLDKAVSSLMDKNKVIEEYKSKIEIMEKNHKFEIRDLRKQIRVAAVRYEELETQHLKTQEILRDKEKQLEIRNIYSSRFTEPNKKSCSFPKPQSMTSGYTCIRRFQRCSNISAKDDSNLKKMNRGDISANIQMHPEMNTVKLTKEQFNIDIRQLIQEEITQIINDKENAPKSISQAPDKYIKSPIIEIDWDEFNNQKGVSPMLKNSESKVKPSLESSTTTTEYVDNQFSDLYPNNNSSRENEAIVMNTWNSHSLNQTIQPSSKQTLKLCKSPCVLNNCDSLCYPPVHFYHFPQIIKQDIRENRQNIQKYKTKLESFKTRNFNFKSTKTDLTHD